MQGCGGRSAAAAVPELAKELKDPEPRGLREAAAAAPARSPASAPARTGVGARR